MSQRAIPPRTVDKGAVPTPAVDLDDAFSARIDEPDQPPSTPVRRKRINSRTALLVAVVVLILVPAGVAFGWSAASPDIHAARVQILFTGGNTQVAQRAEQQTATQMVVLSSRPILQPVARQVGTDVETLQDAVTVEQLEDSEVLQVTVTDEDPERAQEAAQAIADGYLAAVSGGEANTEELELLQEELAGLQGRQQEVDGQLAALAQPDPAPAVVAEQGRLQNESRTIAQRITDIQREVIALRLADLSQSPPSRILTPAYMVADPVGPLPWRSAAAAGLVGAVLTALTAAIVLRPRSPAPPA